MRAWDDAASAADLKWDRVFGDLVPAAQAHVARLLNLPDPNSVVFAPNTHELVSRVLSCLPTRTLRVLTTDGEFHSFARQLARLEEENLVQVTRVATEPCDSFTSRFVDALRGAEFDLVYVSHVFFNSGFVVPDLDAIAQAVRAPETFLVIDGYHAFMGLPVDLSRIANRVFYVAGGYKYAMAGEGAAFLHAPPGYGERPRNTGWFASFGTLASNRSDVPYAQGGGRFWGATFDPSGLYRFRAVADWLVGLGVTPTDIHARAHRLQRLLVAGLGPLALSEEQLIVPVSEASRGQFLTFRTPHAGAIFQELLAKNIVTDVRGDRLRFGFGLYHDDEDVERALSRMRRG